MEKLSILIKHISRLLSNERANWRVWSRLQKFRLKALGVWECVESDTLAAESNKVKQEHLAPTEEEAKLKGVVEEQQKHSKAELDNNKQGDWTKMCYKAAAEIYSCLAEDQMGIIPEDEDDPAMIWMYLKQWHEQRGNQAIEQYTQELRDCTLDKYKKGSSYDMQAYLLEKKSLADKLKIAGENYSDNQLGLSMVEGVQPA